MIIFRPDCSRSCRRCPAGSCGGCPYVVVRVNYYREVILKETGQDGWMIG